MSYKEKPIIKLYQYSNNSFILQAVIDDFQECSFEHNLYQAGTFTITINYNIPNAQKFQRGLFIQFGNDPYDFGEIITISDSIGSDGKGSQIRTITGYDSRYILKRRVIKNMNSNGTWVMTAKGELCIRNLIKDQCGESAEAKRQLPIINTIPASADAIGKEYSVSEQFTNLYEVCKTIATQSEIGWRLNFDGASLTLECYEGEDKSQTVQFSTNFDSLASGEFSDSSESYSNAIYVGGKGQNDDRDIYEGEDGTPEGLDRFESWDNQSSMTTDEEYEAEALSMLTQYGQTVTMNGNGLAKCPYIYKEQYNVGDWITVSFSGKSAVVQILSVTEHWSWGAYDIQFSFGKPLNNLSDQLQLMLRKIQSASEKTQSTDSVRWYTIPTDTAMPKADVTYNTIGFIGNVGSGATFTLYLDNAKTGSKTYHVYFKQLAGSGKLTLTTGKAGATNLVLSVGTYVAIIYVDENGNITTQGATATDVIQTGSTQPATSGAVADEIENVTEIASSLPTDSVLHYSFDEVPDYPDGTAFNFYNNNFVVGDWLTNQATLSVTDGKMKVEGNANYIYALIRQSTYTLANLLGKIVKAKIYVHSANTASNSNFRTVGNDISGNVIIAKEKYDQWIEVTFAINAGTPSNQWLGVVFPTASADNYWQIEILYIGDGSYSTPIIDNANGQNNATNNGGIAVQGVSGKGAYFLQGKYAVVNNFNLNANFSISVWAKADNTTSRLAGDIFVKANHFILRNGANFANGDYLMLYLYDENGTNLTQGHGNIGDLLPNEWTHIVIVRNGTSLKSYRNGVLNKTITLANATINKYTGNCSISNSTNTRPQSIDDLLIFDRALSATEVLALYQNKANTPKYYDLSDYKLKQVNDNAQPQTLATPITIAGQSYTTVESALQALAGAV